jgi:hypothetical protein
MLKRRSFRALLCLAPIFLIASCKDKDSAAAGDGGAAATGAAAPAGKRAAVPADVCKLLSAADVSAILGEKVEPKAVPGGGCQFPGGTAKSLYPTISVQEDTPGAGGIDGAKAGAQATTGGTASPLTVGGASGYVVTGRLGSTATQAAVAKNGLIVTVTVSGGAKAGNEKVVTDILKLVVAKI